MTPSHAMDKAISADVDRHFEPFLRLPSQLAQSAKTLRMQANGNTTHGELARMAATMLEKILTDCGFDLDGKISTE